jgi:galactosylceramidase
MKTRFVSSLLLLFIGWGSATAQTINLSANSTGKQFDGIGAVNGGGATSVLLKDYPEPQRSQIMDMVYKPMFGASVSAILVEVPGDGNSTQGSMPSHSHYRGDANFLRGYMWWVMQEAKRRNSALSLDATSWSAPAWVGNFWSDDMVDYYIDWMKGLRQVHGLELDALGCHNEKGWSADFAKHLRKAMNERGFRDVKLHGFGNWGNQKMDFLKRMQEDRELADALDAVCAHTFSEIQLTPEQRKMAEDMGKPIWNSEDHVYLPGFDCLISIVKCFNANYIVSGATKVINWYDIGATYPLEPYSKEPPMLLAQEPWSGHYIVREALWGYAHYGQFTRVGWRYVDDGCLNLPQGGSMVTMRDPQTGDYSIVAETKGAKKAQTIKVRVADGLSKGKLCVWYSDAKQQFVRLKDITPKGGNFSITLKPDAVYSFSTTTGQQKGSFADIPASKPFPIPYKDDFEQYSNPEEWGYLPHYLADLIGCFELRPSPARKGMSIQQTVGAHTLSWAPEWHHYTILGDAGWKDYEISADIYLNPGDEAGVMGRLCDVGSGYGIWAKGYYLKLDDAGHCTLILTRGKRDQKELIGDKEQQALILARKDVEIGGEYTLAEADVRGISALQWHNLKLRFDGDQIIGYIDGVEVVRATSDHYGRGMAGLIAPLHERSVSTPYFDNVCITPLGRTQATSTTIPTMQPLYRQQTSAAGRETLLQRLKSLSARGIMFGHQDDPFYGGSWQWDRGRSDVLAVCGDYPAVMGFDLGGIEMGDEKNLDRVPFNRIREELLAHVRRGGIATISWHPRNPLTGGTAWDNKNKEVVRSILPGGSQYQKFQLWMLRLSSFLQSLCDEHGRPVPFIFRPWHENSGGWFWWGRGLCSPEEYKALWNSVQDRLLADGLTNIVWSWSPNFGYPSDIFDTYPGDERVDIIGLDAYQQEGREKDFISRLNKDLTELCDYAKKANRLVALTECGYQNLPDPTWWTRVLKPQIEKYPLCYFLVWRNGNHGHYFAPFPGTKDAPDFCRMVEDSKILMLKDIEK